MSENGNLLSGIKVIDITNNYAGPISAALLCDYGAEVIHIEKPVLGDDSRYFLPIVDGQSLAFGGANRGKKSLVLDLKDPKAVEIIKKMIVDTDVLVESNRPGVMKRLGLDYDTLKEINPRLIYCSVSAFGHKGPYSQRAGYDVIAQAFSGIMYKTGEPDGDPTKIGVVIGDSVGTLNAFAGIMSALYYRERTGKGQFIDISLARGLMMMCSSFDFQVTGKVRERTGNHDRGMCPYGVFNGNNGEAIIIAALSPNTWKNLCVAMKREDLTYDPEYATNDVRVKNKSTVISLVENWVKSFDSVDQVEALLQEMGVPCSKIYNDKDIFEDPHVQACEWVKPVPVMDGITSIDHSYLASGYMDMSECKPSFKKPPTLGQHNHEILEQYGMTPEEVDQYQEMWAAKANTARKGK